MPSEFYNDKNSAFNELIEEVGSLSIHHQNLQKLVAEMFKFSRAISPEIINEIFQFRKEKTYELRQRSQFHIPSVHIPSLVQNTLNFLDRRYGHWCLMKCNS